jgi:hypothetical protein
MCCIGLLFGYVKWTGALLGRRVAHLEHVTGCVASDYALHEWSFCWFTA